MSQAVYQKCGGLGPWPLTVTRPPGQWAFYDGNEPGQMFIQELQETVWASEGGSKDPFTHIPPRSIPGLQSQPPSSAIWGGRVPNTTPCSPFPETIPGRKESLEHRTPPGILTPFPVFSAILGVDYGEATSSAFILDTQKHGTHFSPGPWGNF